MKLLIILAICASMIGCSTTGSGVDRNKLAFQYAVLKVTDSNPEKISALKDWVQEARSQVGEGGIVSVDSLAEYFRHKLSETGLDSADLLLANEVINSAQAIIEEDKRELEVNKVLDWIELVL